MTTTHNADPELPADESAGQPVEVSVLNGDSLSILRSLPADSFDSVITDPPYAIRALKAAASPATGRSTSAARPTTVEKEIATFSDAAMLGQQSANWHEKATHSRGYADNDPHQFQRWCFLWTSECLRVLKPGGHLVAFGGTRTWHRLASAAEDAGFEVRDSLAWLYGTGFPKSVDVARALAHHGVDNSDYQATSESWRGWGTALKPAHEPIVLARKPLIGTVAANIERYGTGGLNIDGCRIADNTAPATSPIEATRWPTNVYLDDDMAAQLDLQSQATRASRFFWVAKPSSAERVKVNGVAHPTVKPVELMRQLVRLVTPPGGRVLDPFAGSGTTVEACLLEGVHSLAIEREERFVPLIDARIARALSQPESRPHPTRNPQPAGAPTLFDFP